MDPPDGVPSGQYRHQDWKNHTRALPIGPRFYSEHTFTIQVGKTFTFFYANLLNLCGYIEPCYTELTKLSVYFAFMYTCGWMNVSSYEWIVPITWIKTGAPEKQYWLVNKEGKIYFIHMLREV